MNNQHHPEVRHKTVWFNDQQIVGTLLLFWPPVGLYGVYKSEVIEFKWKVVVYTSFMIAIALLITTFIVKM